MGWPSRGRPISAVLTGWGTADTTTSILTQVGEPARRLRDYGMLMVVAAMTAVVVMVVVLIVVVVVVTTITCLMLSR